ncbi:MAG TPA: nucleotidyl transferase AbiEii/AbiGii toxin family protein [bacterium]|nr:nucleotidyl transferase AbiEii/AbiGii toxin family protein [bacterium]
MTSKIIQERLDSYQCRSVQEEENALREITQEIVLAGLSRAEFFKATAFQGGTCLRVLYSLERFSEDLDFVLQKPLSKFSFEPYFKNLRLECEAYGFQLETVDRSAADLTVKKGFVKDDSIGKILIFKHLKVIRGTKKINIKIEVDTNPPAGSHFETRFLDFPFPFSVTTQNLPSLFAGKSHALLCREYVKGRDWYDFILYATRKTPVNFELLSSALDQQGPWAKQGLKIDRAWYFEQMEMKIRSIDWEAAKRDISRFLKSPQLETLKLWSQEFFLSFLEKLQITAGHG